MMVKMNKGDPKDLVGKEVIDNFGNRLKVLEVRTIKVNEERDMDIAFLDNGAILNVELLKKAE